MTTYPATVKWGKETLSITLDPSTGPAGLKSQLNALTNVPHPPYENHAQIQGAVEGATQGRCRFVCLIVRGAGAAVVDGECGGIAGETQGQDCVFGGFTSRGEGQVR